MVKKFLVCALTTLFWFKLFAGDRGTIECYERDGEHRSSISFSFEQTKPDIFRLLQKGRGDYDTHRNVTWETESIIELKDNIYRPLRSLRTIRDKDGRDIKELKLEYNYDSKLIYFTVTTPNITIKKKFPLKGITVDGSNLLMLVSKLIENRKPYFYLMTDLANMYKINIKYDKEQQAKIKGKNIEAVRVRMFPDMGVLDTFIENTITPSYGWYTKGAPCKFLRYEGKEVDRDSRNVITFANN
jgi:hypothetical protein